MDDQALVSRLRDGLRLLNALPNRVEADTRQHLVDVLIEWLEYDTTRVRRERTDRHNRPDYLLFGRPVTEAGPARVVVEAKALGADFDATRGEDRGESPDRQATRYLRHHAASGPSTLGALTDGLRWRLYRQVHGAVEGFGEIDLAPLVRGQQASHDPLDRLRDALARPRRGGGGDPGGQALRALAAALRVADPDESARQALSALGATDEPLAPIDLDQLESRDHDQVQMEWEHHAHAHGPRLEPMKGEQLLLEAGPEQTAVRLAVVRFRHEPTGIGRGDVARCARIVAAQTPTRTAAVLVWQSGPDDSVARLAFVVGRSVVMTQPFDPEMPPPSAREAVERMLRLLAKKSTDRAALAAALDVRPLQLDFYTSIRDWTRHLRREAHLFGDAPAGDHHEILLRHLVRVIFAWILQHETHIPPALFEPSFAEEHGIDDYHRDVLRFLFHGCLNTPNEARAPHRLETVRSEFDRIPFLNGSLFEERPWDNHLHLPNEAYWRGNDESDVEPGLFDILARYHWTADEQRPGEREQTLDPELLSNLFEQLAADPVLERRDQQGGGKALKAPDGAYYTPMDVAAEMAADALAATVRPLWPNDLDEETLLDLFRDPEAAPALADIREPTRDRIAARLETLRVFDPAVGSGAFLLAILQALRSALRTLRPESSDPTRRIVTHQLAGQDINPMAAQIARLRLFVALQSAPGADEDEPLPNLEARIVCADTLHTHPVPAYDPFVRGLGRQMDLVAAGRPPELSAALRRLAAVREQWPDDHTEAAKDHRRTEDRDAREHLRRVLEQFDEYLAGGAKEELYELADHPMLEPRYDAPARVDPRLLFAQDEEDWPGFDIVIGNPPYQSFRRSGISTAQRRAIEDRGYRTTGVADISALFCEAALALARPDGGVVELVMPVSLAAGRRQLTLRRLFEEECSSLSVRHYNVAPDRIFNAHPLFKAWKNRQRTTIVTAVRGKVPPRLHTDALLRWQMPDRPDVLRRRPHVELQHHGNRWIERGEVAALRDGAGGGLAEGDAGLPDDQWPRIPNRAVYELVRAVTHQTNRIANLTETYTDGDAHVLALPDTAGYFVAAIPPGHRVAMNEVLRSLTAEDEQLLVMAALSGHVAFAWRLVFGDGWHVSWRDFATFTVPDAWMQAPDQALPLARRLLNGIPDAHTVSSYHEQDRENVNFFLMPRLVEEVDRLHIASLDLDPDQILPSLHRMRSPNGWAFGAE